MNSRGVSVIFTLLPLLLSPLVAHSADAAAPQTQHIQSSPGLNFADPSTWMKPNSARMPLNLAHPATWMMFADPKAHTTIHTAFMNPANYSQFMHGLLKAGIELDRKVLSDIAINEPASFKALVDQAQAALAASA